MRDTPRRTWWRAHVPARPSTLVLTGVFALSLIVYFLVRPDPSRSATHQPGPAVPSTSSPPTPTATPTAPVSTAAPPTPSATHVGPPASAPASTSSSSAGSTTSTAPASPSPSGPSPSPSITPAG